MMFKKVLMAAFLGLAVVTTTSCDLVKTDQDTTPQTETVSLKLNIFNSEKKIDFKKGTKVNLKAYVPLVKNYKFEGWYADKEFMIRFAYSSFTIEYDTVLYANMIKDETETETDPGIDVPPIVPPTPTPPTPDPKPEPKPEPVIKYTKLYIKGFGTYSETLEVEKEKPFILKNVLAKSPKLLKYNDKDGHYVATALKIVDTLSGTTYALDEVFNPIGDAYNLELKYNFTFKAENIGMMNTSLSVNNPLKDWERKIETPSDGNYSYKHVYNPRLGGEKPIFTRTSGLFYTSKDISFIFTLGSTLTSTSCEAMAKSYYNSLTSASTTKIAGKIDFEKFQLTFLNKSYDFEPSHNDTELKPHLATNVVVKANGLSEGNAAPVGNADITVTDDFLMNLKDKKNPENYLTVKLVKKEIVNHGDKVNATLTSTFELKGVLDDNAINLFITKEVKDGPGVPIFTKCTLFLNTNQYGEKIKYDYTQLR